jgi:hypothetical protein
MLPENITFWQAYYRRKAIGKVYPITCHEGRGGKQSYISTLSLTLVLDGVGWLMPCPGYFTPRE